MRAALDSQKLLRLMCGGVELLTMNSGVRRSADAKRNWGYGMQKSRHKSDVRSNKLVG